jgi:transcriptional regulator with XRE-family HTH domain
MKATLSSTFAELRAERHLTLLQIALKCQLAETTIFKVEQGRTVRWETLHLILSVGFGIHPGTERYEEFHRLWLMQRAEIAESKPPESNAKTLSKHAVVAMRQFRELIRHLDEPTMNKVMVDINRSVQCHETKPRRARKSSM